MSIVNPEVDQLLNKVDSKFTLCTLASKRACQINDMVHGVREQALSAMATSEIAKLTSAKPLALAMDEIARGDVSPEAPLPKELAKKATGPAEALTPQAEIDALPVLDDISEEVKTEEAAAKAASAKDDLLG